MTTELNQVQDMTTDIDANSEVVEEDDLFADYDASKNTYQPDEFEEEDDQPSKEVEDKKDSSENDSQDAGTQNPTEFMKVKYNKEDRSLTKDEAIEFAQKGMNYDHVLEKYNAIKDQEITLSELNQLARRANLSTNDLMNYLKDQWNEKELNDEVDLLRNQYPNSDEALLVELAKSHISNGNSSNPAIRKEQESVAAKKQEISRQMDVFAERYPNVDPTKLDAQVYQLMKGKGPNKDRQYTLLEAYETVQADIRAKEEKEKESLDKINRQNEENKKKSLGNTNNNGIGGSMDDFEKALFSD